MTTLIRHQSHVWERDATRNIVGPCEWCGIAPDSWRSTKGCKQRPYVPPLKPTYERLQPEPTLTRVMPRENAPVAARTGQNRARANASSPIATEPQNNEPAASHTNDSRARPKSPKLPYPATQIAVYLRNARNVPQRADCTKAAPLTEREG